MDLLLLCKESSTPTTVAKIYFQPPNDTKKIPLTRMRNDLSCSAMHASVHDSLPSIFFSLLITSLRSSSLFVSYVSVLDTGPRRASTVKCLQANFPLSLALFLCLGCGSVDILVLSSFIIIPAVVLFAQYFAAMASWGYCVLVYPFVFSYFYLDMMGYGKRAYGIEGCVGFIFVACLNRSLY